MIIYRRSAQWQALVRQQHVSGLSAVQFFKQQDFSYACFFIWRKRLSENQAEEPSTFKNTGFLDLTSLMSQSSEPGWNIALSLGNSVELRLSQQRR